MKKLSISLPFIPKRSYPVFVGSILIEKINTLIDFSGYSNLFIITDETVATFQLDKLQKSLQVKSGLIILPSGETAKELKYLTKIWQGMIDAKLDRKSLVINLGGGVIGDIGGFAASTYMRGIDFINIPTTLLAQVDESVGGKTMIDFHGIKNIIGTFYQPTAVIIDVETLKTLPERHIRNGFAEIIKTGLIIDKKYFEKTTSKKPSEFSKEELIEIIERGNEIKSVVVQKDEKESGYRKILNYGHTVGHAIEALSLSTNRPLLHGESISIGMVAENEIAVQTGLLSEKAAEIIKKVLMNTGLPVKIPEFKIKDIMTKMKLDKKNIDGKINFSLIKEVGVGMINQTVPVEIIEKAIKKL